jgi:flagellar basal body-associated protein FliL
MPFSKKKKKSYEKRLLYSLFLLIIVIIVLFRLKSVTIFAGMSVEMNGCMSDPSIDFPGL